MKKIFIPLFLFLLWGCTKSMDSLSYQDELQTSFTSGSIAKSQWDTIRQIGRISWWMLYTESNYTSQRADYAEILISDTFNAKVDSQDKIKEDSTIGSDNIAFIAPYTPEWTHQKLLWKEQRRYPEGDQDVISTKLWNLTSTHYVFKIICTNFPDYIKVYLWDKATSTTIAIPRDGSILYLPVDASTAILQDSHRFSFIIHRV